MSATLRYNPEHTAFEVTAGNQTWAQEIDDATEPVMLHHDNGCYVVTLDQADFDGLQPNSVYELAKVTTVLKPEENFEFDPLPGEFD